MSVERSDVTSSGEQLAFNPDMKSLGCLPPKSRFRHDYWAIGVVDAPPEVAILGDTPVSYWIENPNAGTFLADPFSLDFYGETILLCEEFDYLSGQGFLVSGRVDEDRRFRRVARLLPDRIHRSYPFPFAFEGKPYVVPEQSELGNVVAYEFVEPGLIVERSILLDDFAGMDATLFFGHGYWWMFVSDAKDGAAGRRLHLFFSDNPLKDWQPHPASPVVVDPSCARPAGQIIVGPDGRMVRPGQNCVETYGGGIALNEIEVLSTTDYQERTIGFMTAENTSYPHGLHTVSEFGRLGTLIDAKRIRRRFDGTVGRIRKRLKKLYGKS